MGNPQINGFQMLIGDLRGLHSASAACRQQYLAVFKIDMGHPQPYPDYPRYMGSQNSGKNVKIELSHRTDR
jgi:hypothetical protein